MFLPKAEREQAGTALQELLNLGCLSIETVPASTFPVAGVGVRVVTVCGCVLSETADAPMHKALESAVASVKAHLSFTVDKDALDA